MRGGQQLQAYDAVYGPVGDDGYPKPLFNRLTGTIDKSVAAYWRDNGYDLNWYLKQNWSRIGRNLSGKIRVYTGDMDNFYLNLAVYRMEETMKTFTDPPANADLRVRPPDEAARLAAVHQCRHGADDVRRVPRSSRDVVRR